jgi:hypothetical protein
VSIISPRVREEVCQAPAINPDARIIAQTIAEGRILVNPTILLESDALLRVVGIHRRETEAILLAKV